jgi:hypothetical protein
VLLEFKRAVHCCLKGIATQNWTGFELARTNKFRILSLPTVTKGCEVTTEEILLSQYRSPLLTLTQLAHILNRSPNGLRISLNNNSDVAQQLNAARVKIGRRVFFKTVQIAKIIDKA